MWNIVMVTTHPLVYKLIVNFVICTIQSAKYTKIIDAEFGYKKVMLPKLLDYTKLIDQNY